ncbi:MAG: hypothetical protein IKO47_13590 [Ruminococcus sp.]|nr:hypothetical protein [Ruminococcus sp.]
MATPMTNATCMDLPTIITAVTAIVSVIIATIALIQTHRQYKDGIQPQLSMKLLEYDGFLYLQIKNTGGLAAKNIRVNVLKVENNGASNQLNLGRLFKQSFELYPEEIVQDRVALFGASIADDAFPQIVLKAEYSVGKRKKTIKLQRTITFVSAYAEKIAADVNMNMSNIESSARSIARAVVRTANYLDGNQVYYSDELNILSGKSLANDLHNTLRQSEEPVKSREETIRAAIGSERTEIPNADA